MINSDDPRLTAYVLGELEDAERAEVESALATSPELQSEVESIRQTAELIDDSLQTEVGLSLTNEQRLAIEEQSSAAAVELAEHSTSISGSFWRRHVVEIVTTSIVGLLLVALLLPAVHSAREASRRVAQTSSVERSDELPSDKLNYQYLPEDLRQQIAELSQAASETTPTDGFENDAMDFSFGERSFGAKQPGVGGFDATAPQDGVLDVDDAVANISRGAMGIDLHAEEAATNGDSRSGMQSPDASRSDGDASDGQREGRDRSLSSGPIAGVPAIQRADRSAEPAPRSIEQGRLSGGKGLSADISTARGEGEDRAVAVTPQPSVGDLLGKLEESGATTQPGTPSESRRADAAHAVSENAGSEVTESWDINKRSPQSIPETQVRRQALEVTGSDNELREKTPGRVNINTLDRATARALGLEMSNVELEEKAENSKRTWRRAQATPNASRLVIGDQDELLMEGMQANVMVDGFRARVLLDLYYFNDRDRQLEGNFKLRLPDDASLYYFAFGESAYEYRPQVDQLASKGFLNGELVRAAGLGPKGILEAREGSWSKVKESRVVPREKAAHAYSETVRRRVDPALVEWSGAGMFNARVFPLMPNKLHRIVVGYDVNLQQVGNDFVYRLDLPEDVAQCMVDLNVSALPGTNAEIQPTTRPFVSSGRAYYHFDEIKDNAVELRFSGTGPVLLKGQDPQAGDFFAARVTPKLPEGEMLAGAERATFLVDTSLSSRPDKFNVWLSLLESVLTKNRETMKHFSVLFFNIDSHWWREADVDNTPENVDALMTYCHTLSLEGATDLRQALREATSPSWAEKDEDKTTPRDLFLLSDGAVTWGEMNLHPLSKCFAAGQTLFAYNTGMAGTSTATLEHLTRETGGAVFSIVNEDEVAAAATAHRSRPWKLLDVTMAGGSDLLIAGRPRHIYPGQPLLIVGRGEPDAEAMLKVSRGDEAMQLAVKFERVVESDLAARAYGQVAVGQLEDLGSSLEDVSVAYARHFRVTGQTCSLLMLDSEADYQGFNIKPEDDLFVVRSTPPASLITQKLDELAEQLADAKAHVVAWLGKLQNTDGFQFELPTALQLVIERLPQSAFEVEPARLICKSHERGELPKEFILQLDSGKLDYDTVTAQANLRHEKQGAADGLRALSSLIELNPGDPVLTRDVAYSAIEWGLGGQAFPLLQRVASMRPYEPQSYLAMAQCLADIGHADLAMVYYEVALNAHWHDRYKDIRDIAGVEYLRLLRRIDRGELTSHAPDYAKARLESLVQQTPVNEADVVVTLMWNTDRTDVDLHVLEPTGEECFYSHPTTRIGGHVTRDITEGLGPEMYTLPKAKQGSYKIMANYFGSDANRTNVRTKVYITVYRDFGGKQEQVEKKTITLSDQKEKRELTTVVIKD